MIVTAIAGLLLDQADSSAQVTFLQTLDCLSKLDSYSTDLDEDDGSGL